MTKGSLSHSGSRNGRRSNPRGLRDSPRGLRHGRTFAIKQIRFNSKRQMTKKKASEQTTKGSERRSSRRPPGKYWLSASEGESTGGRHRHHLHTATSRDYR